jgi:uncharacterized membrane protein (TIGR02234 family)
VAERAGRRTFGPTVAVGLAGAGLAAFAGNETWVVGTDCVTSVTARTGGAESPATTAVALALMASWGVLLVTRGRFRRLLSVLTALLALGLALTVLLDIAGTADALRATFRSTGLDCAGVHRTGWCWTAVASLPFVVVPALAAVRLVPGWPEMGRRYDAPADATPTPVQPPEEQENLDLWKAMDEGRDPTA